VQVVANLVQEFLGSNLDRETEYPDFFYVLLSLPTEMPKQSIVRFGSGRVPVLN
jgi:hypothetical protein